MELRKYKGKYQYGGRVYFNTKSAANPLVISIENPRKQTETTSESTSEIQSQEQQYTTNWIDEILKGFQITNQPEQESKSPEQQIAKSIANESKSDNMKAAMSHLISKGYSKEQAAGIVGVFAAESGLNIGAINRAEQQKYGNSAGFGIAQWSNSRRKGVEEYLAAHGGNSLENQLDYFLQEAATRPAFMAALNNAKTVDDAVRAMHLGFENGSATALATPDSLTQTYSKAWEKLGYGPYDYQKSHNKRLAKANTAYSLV